MAVKTGHRYRKTTCPTCQRKIAANVKGKHHKAAHGTPWPQNGARKPRSVASESGYITAEGSTSKPHLRVLQDATCAAIRSMDLPAAKNLIDIMELTLTDQG